MDIAQKSNVLRKKYSRRLYAGVNESKCKPNISPVSSGKPWESVQLFWLLRYYVQEY